MGQVDFNGSLCSSDMPRKRICQIGLDKVSAMECYLPDLLSLCLVITPKILSLHLPLLAFSAHLWKITM